MRDEAWSVISNDLDANYAVWDDPGDYPCGAGGSPLDSYAYVEEVEGTVVLALKPEEDEFWFECLHYAAEVSEYASFEEVYRVALDSYVFDLLYDVGNSEIQLPEGVSNVTWQYEFSPDCRKVVLTVKEFASESRSLRRRGRYSRYRW
jgi:hypothetical protein